MLKLNVENSAHYTIDCTNSNEKTEYLEGSEPTSRYPMTAAEFSCGGERRGGLACVTLVKVWRGLSMHM